MLHVLTELSATATDQEIKDVTLANFSDIPSTAEAAAKLQSLQIKHVGPFLLFDEFGELLNKPLRSAVLVVWVGKIRVQTKTFPQRPKELLNNCVTDMMTSYLKIAP